MKKCIVLHMVFLYFIIAGCAVAPKTQSSERSEKRADKRAEVLRAKVSSQNEAVVADADSSEKRVDSIRSRRGNAQRPAPTANERTGRSSTQKPPSAEDINPAQTSEDPTFGRTKENPVKLGSESAGQGAASSYVYLRQLRDMNRIPFKFVRVGNVGQGDDGHFIDLYKLTDSKGAESKIFVDMYHPENSPLDCKAPAGMFIAQ